MNRLDLSVYHRGKLLGIKTSRQIEREAQSWPALIFGSLLFAALFVAAAIAVMVW